MDAFRIDALQTGKVLEGEIAISGAKNAVLPMMASALLAEGVSVITNALRLRKARLDL